MTKSVAIYIPKKSYLNEATNYYCDLIIEGLGCHEKNIFTSLTPLKKFDIVFVLDAKSLFFVKSRYPFKKVVTWYQGVVPEEAIMQFNSKLKFLYWRVFEFLSLKLTYINIFVSDSMAEHYRKVYGFVGQNYVVIPCFNKVLSEEKITANKNKYDSISFVYAGSLHKWQCIDQTLAFFKNVQSVYPSASLLFLTFDVNAAQDIIKKYDIKNVEVLCVPENQVDDYIAKCRFGFLIRESNIVNRVATPTKMSTYLSVGTIPVMTNTITDFNNHIVTKYSFIYDLNENSDAVSNRFFEHLASKVDVDKLVQDYNFIFTTYYNRERYIKSLDVKLESMIH